MIFPGRCWETERPEVREQKFLGIFTLRLLEAALSADAPGVIVEDTGIVWQPWFRTPSSRRQGLHLPRSQFPLR